MDKKLCVARTGGGRHRGCGVAAGGEDRRDPAQGQPRRFSLPAQIPPNCYALDGEWTVGAEEITASAGARLDLSFYADQVYLVLKPGVADARVDVLLDGASVADSRAGRDVQNGALTVGEPRLYSLVDLPKVERHVLTLEPEKGVMGYAFTFG